MVSQLTNSKLILPSEVYVARLRKLIAEKQGGLDLEATFLYHDEHKQGTIKPVQFKYIMSEKCGFTKEEYENLANFLDPNGDDAINYTELIKLLKDPEYIN